VISRNQESSSHSAFEVAFRELLKTAIMEAIGETSSELGEIGRNKMIEEPKQSLLLRAREAAESLAISEAHLSRLTRRGLIPSVRVGQCLRYSVEELRTWVRESQVREVTAPDKKPAERATNIRGVAIKKLDAKSLSKREKQPKTIQEKDTKKTPVVIGSRKPTPSLNREKRVSPFQELLAEIGIERSSLPPITNGEIMRIAEVDLPVCHGWLFLNRPLPEEAREKLKKHFSTRK
jgi:excisionase family DNA binding protein